jgi:hypothetical protein
MDPTNERRKKNGPPEIIAMVTGHGISNYVYFRLRYSYICAYITPIDGHAYLTPIYSHAYPYFADKYTYSCTPDVNN